MSKMLRREFLRRAPAAVAGGALGAIGFENRQAVMEAAFQKQLVDFTAAGHQYRGVFHVHGDRDVLLQDQISAADLKHPVTIQEDVSTQYLPPDGGADKWYVPVSEFVAAAGSEAPPADERNSYRLLDYLVTQGKQVRVFNDLPLTDRVIVTWDIAPLALAGAAGVLGKYLFDRRRFLRLPLRWLGTWASVGMFRYFANLGDAVLPEKGAAALAKVNYLADLTHPESAVETFRELVVAAKTLDLGLDANLVFGKTHWTLPYHLRSGQPFLHQVLRQYPDEFIDAVMPDRRYLYTSVLVYRNQSGIIVQDTKVHENLRRIFTA
jgi:hypothetical protein